NQVVWAEWEVAEVHAGGVIEQDDPSGDAKQRSESHADAGPGFSPERIEPRTAGTFEHRAAIDVCDGSFARVRGGAKRVRRLNFPGGVSGQGRGRIQDAVRDTVVRARPLL